MPTVFARIFIEVNADQAPAIAAALKQQWAALADDARIVGVRPYWKIPEYQEVTLEVGLNGDSAHVIATATAQLGTGWVFSSTTEAFWNPGPTAAFVNSAVRWAHVEIVE